MAFIFVNYQVKSDSQFSVVNYVKKICQQKCYVSPPDRGWVTIYDEKSEKADYPELDLYINNFSLYVSKYLKSTVIAFVLFNGVSIFYFIYNNGKLIDEFCDNPKLAFNFGFKKVDKQVLIRFQGSPEKLAPYLAKKNTLENLKQVLTHIKQAKDGYLGEDAAYHISLLFGINEYRAMEGYHSFQALLASPDDEDDEHINNLKNFILVDSTNDGI